LATPTTGIGSSSRRWSTLAPSVRVFSHAAGLKISPRLGPSIPSMKESPVPVMTSALLAWSRESSSRAAGKSWCVWPVKHVAQPAVSEQVRKLEDELGVRLFNRTQRSVSLTDAGAALLREARGVLRHAEVARLAARNGATSRLRIGYMPTSLPASVPRTLQRLAGAMSRLETGLEPGSGLELIEAVRAERLDAAIVSLPAPRAGLRTTALGDQRLVAALPVGHDRAVKSAIRLEQVAPERLVVLPRDANRPVYDAVIATCRNADLSPTLVEMPDGHVERALLAVASGAGMALLPESVAEHYAAPGVRFVPLDGELPAIATAVVTRRDTAHMPTVAFLRAVAQAAKPRILVASEKPLTTAA
jgi:DNA-binding transcriptional LysR family regulator